MRRYFLTNLFIFSYLWLFGQVTVQGKSRDTSQYEIKTLRFLFGYNYQGNVNIDIFKNRDSIPFKRHFLELGLHRAKAHVGYYHPVATMYGGSVELLLEKKPILGFKTSYWIGMSFVVAGINLIYYTDFKYGNLKIRPEFGYGNFPFKATIGWNLPTFANQDFERMQLSPPNVTLNILLNIKTISIKKM